MSTTEAEYIAVVEACKEANWLTPLVKNLGITIAIPKLHYGSQCAIKLAKNPKFLAKTRHIEVNNHFIRDMLEDKLMKLVNDNLATLFTKGLPLEWFEHYQALMGVE